MIFMYTKYLFCVHDISIVRKKQENLYVKPEVAIYPEGVPLAMYRMRGNRTFKSYTWQYKGENMDILVELVEEEDCLEANAINVIYGEGRDLFLPEVSELTMIQILFVTEGDFKIYATAGAQIGVGSLYGEHAITSPGQPGHDTQPKFVFIPSLNRWVIISISVCYTLPDEEPKEENS